MPSVCILCIRPTLKRFNSKISFHVFPTCPKKRQIWIKTCKLTDQEVLPRHKICSFHFKPTCFKVNAKRRILHSDAVPTIFEKRYAKKKNLLIKIVKEGTKDCNEKEIGHQNQQSLVAARDILEHLQNVARSQKKKIDNLDTTIKKLEEAKAYFMSQLELANVRISMVNQMKK